MITKLAGIEEIFSAWIIRFLGLTRMESCVEGALDLVGRSRVVQAQGATGCKVDLVPLPDKFN